MKRELPAIAFLGALPLAIVGILLTLVPLANDARVDGRETTQTADALYAEGVALAPTDDAAARAKFRASADASAAALEQGDSAALHYNRANALLRAGALGTAIAQYRAAESRAPHDARIAANLAEARSKVSRPTGVPAPTLTERACGVWSFAGERTRWGITLTLLWIAVIGMVTRKRTLALGCFYGAALVGLTVTLDVLRRADHSRAVVSEAAPLRKGNGEGFEAVLVESLPEGCECRLLEVRPGWIEVELADGTRGWINDRSLELVR